MAKKIYSKGSQDPDKFRDDFDKFYTSVGGVYDLVVKIWPAWKRWLNHALPHIRGERVLEVSFGTGYLLTKYAGKYDTHGIDYNARMVEIAKQNLKKAKLSADIREGNVEQLPYVDGFFDTIVNTMSFTGYPDGESALSEMKRVMRPGGLLILIDINYPSNDNWFGTVLTRVWQAGGDIIRDMDALFEENEFKYQDLEIGGFGSVHMYLCER
jgi:ubiquinone/menaquinone biosynthesis C-methylase UbiE